jgi:hypothetical protein
MSNTQNTGKIFSIMSFVLFPSLASHAQTSAQAFAQTSSIAISQRVSALIGEYEAASEIMKANVARSIAKEVRPLRQDPAATEVLARADIVLSRQAATDGRKNLALSKARDAQAMAARITTPDGRVVRARAASVVARALLLQEDYLEAVRTITAARRAFGPVETNADPAIDELEMWDSIARVSIPPRLASQMQALVLSKEESDALAEAVEGECSVGGKEIERNRRIGSEPIFPVLSGLRGIGGGVVTRSSVDATGRVTRVVTTAYSPTEGFAAAAEQAARSWLYDVPVGVSEVCRANLRTMFSFGFK